MRLITAEHHTHTSASAAHLCVFTWVCRRSSIFPNRSSLGYTLFTISMCEHWLCCVHTVCLLMYMCISWCYRFKTRLFYGSFSAFDPLTAKKTCALLQKRESTQHFLVVVVVVVVKKQWWWWITSDFLLLAVPKTAQPALQDLSLLRKTGVIALPDFMLSNRFGLRNTFLLKAIDLSPDYIYHPLCLYNIHCTLYCSSSGLSIHEFV